jgi:hypothetical protein
MLFTDHRLLRDSSAAISDPMFEVLDPAVLELSDMRILSARRMPVWVVAFRQPTNSGSSNGDAIFCGTGPKLGPVTGSSSLRD